eukprot:scaffold20374_cov78-Skeletonema_dohrnii-CCMP3373.AAC.2
MRSHLLSRFLATNSTNSADWATILLISGALCFVAIVIQFARKEYCYSGGDDDSSQDSFDDSSQDSFDEMEDEESDDSIHVQEPQIARVRDHRSSRRQPDRKKSIDDSSQDSFHEMDDEESNDSTHIQEPQIARVRDHRSNRRQYDRNERRRRDLYDI